MVMVTVFSRWLRPLYGLYLFWILFNGLLFWNTFRSYKGKPQYYYLYDMLGSGLCISRGSGAVLNFSCGFILLPACKLLHTRCCRFLSETFGAGSNLMRTLFNQVGVIHTISALTIVIASVIHTSAHIMNVINFSMYYNSVWPDINMASFSGQHPLVLIIKTVPGITGLLLLLILFAICFTSISIFRKSHYNFFYLLHNILFGPFLILLVLHPSSGSLKEQINWQEHSPGKSNQETPPIFKPIATYTWLWVSIPLGLYIIDLLYRRISCCQPIKVSQTILHGGNVIELVFSHRIKCRPGQYVLLQCVTVSGFEWHPFSLSSCCDLTHEKWTLHLKINGDWCKRLNHLAVSNVREMEFYVDGPFTSPFCNILQSRIVICIAGGVGLTPFHSIILDLIRNGWKKIKHFHLVWCIKQPEHIFLFQKAINQLIEDAWSSSRPDKLEVRLHVTQKSSLENFKMRKIYKEFPSIYRRIEYGRPKWTDLFKTWNEIYAKEPRVNVFSCGPNKLNQQVKQMCQSRHNFAVACENFG